MMRTIVLPVLFCAIDAKRTTASLDLDQRYDAQERSNQSEATAAAYDKCDCHTDLMREECVMMAFDGLNGRTCDSNKPVNFGSCMASKGKGLVKECCPKSCCAAKKLGKASTGDGCAPSYKKAHGICKAVAMDMGKGLRLKKAEKGRIGQMWKTKCEKSTVADKNFESVAINKEGTVVKVDNKGHLTGTEVDEDTFSLPGSQFNFGNGCTLMCGDKTSDQMLAENNGNFNCVGKRTCVFLEPSANTDANDAAAMKAAERAVSTPIKAARSGVAVGKKGCDERFGKKECEATLALNGKKCEFASDPDNGNYCRLERKKLAVGKKGCDERFGKKECEATLALNGKKCEFASDPDNGNYCRLERRR